MPKNSNKDLVIITRFPFRSQLGGEEWHTHDLFKYLQKKNNLKFEFYGSCKVLAKLFKTNTKILPKSPVSKLQLVFYTLLLPYTLLRFYLKAQSSKNKNHVYYMLSLSEKLFLAPFLKRFNIPYVFVEHATIGNWLLKNPFYKLYLKNLDWKKAQIVTVSKLMEQALKIKKTKVIPNAINQRFKPKSKFLGLNKVLYIGRLTEDKGMEQLIKLANNFKNIKFIAIGKGPYKEMLKQNGIKVYNKMSHKKIMEFLTKVDLLVLPATTKDPFGLVVLEAMSRNVPSLISENVGIKDYLKNKEEIMVFSSDIVESLNQFIKDNTIKFVFSNLQDSYRKFSYHHMALSYFKTLNKF